jgi:phosphatidylinositol 3-kinase
MRVVGGTSVSLFGKHGVLRRGMVDLKVWPGQVAHPSLTPGGKTSQQTQMETLAKLAKRHRNGFIPKVDWLDRLTFRYSLHHLSTSTPDPNYYQLIGFRRKL